jgi:hypothetical protein
VGVQHVAGTPHLADDLPTGVTDTTVVYPRKSLLSLFVPQRKRGQNVRTWQSTTNIQLFQFLEWRRLFLTPYSSVMTIYSPWYIKRCFIIEYPSPKVLVIFISFYVWQNVFGKLETAGFIVRVQSLHNLHFVGMEVKAITNNPPKGRLLHNWLQRSSCSWFLRGSRKCFLDSINIFLRSASSSQFFSVQNITSLLK